MRITQLTKRIVFDNTFGILYNDIVRLGSSTGEYLRWCWRSSDGVVGIPLCKDRFILASMFRYPIDKYSLEFPRGGVSGSESLEEAVTRETKEELGVQVKSVKLIGSIFPDSGLIANKNHVFVIEIEKPEKNLSSHDPMESVSSSLVHYDRYEFLNAISQNRIYCGITIAAFSVYCASLLADEHLEKYKSS